MERRASSPVLLFGTSTPFPSYNQRIPMKVENVHSRAFDRPPTEVGALINTLASDQDRLWPSEQWPAMKFDRSLEPGSCGGHGPIRYCVERFESGSLIRFRFTAPRGFDGYHEFSVVDSAPRGCRLSHMLKMEVTGPALLSWPLIFRPLHDALIEDSLTKAQRSLGARTEAKRWPLRVRTLRWMFRLLRRS
jgi:hypothetical protein